MPTHVPVQPGPSPVFEQFTLSLTSCSDRVYNNGRQQIELSVLLVPTAGSGLNPISDSAISLVYQTDQGEWLPLPLAENNAWFYSDVRDERYDYYPALANLAVPVEVAPHAYLKRLYIHSVAEPGETLTVRGCMILPSGERIYTSDAFAITLYAEVSPTYQFPEDYHWQPHLRVNDRLFEQGADRSDRFICEYALRPFNVDFSFARLLTSASFNHLVRWDTAPRSNNATLVSVVTPQAGSIDYSPVLSDFSSLHGRLAKDIVSCSRGQITVVMQGDPDVPRALVDHASGQPLMLEAYDRHGGLHRLAIDFATPVDRLDLTVRAQPAAPTSEIANVTYFRVAGRGLSQDAASCRLYSNGYQQTYVTVTLEAVDSQGEHVTVPQQVLDAVTLVNYDTGQALPNSYTVTRVRSDLDKRFSYYQNQRATPQTSPPAPHGQTITLHIKTSSTQNIRVAARLQQGIKTYHTYDRQLPAGDGYTSAGRSNTSAMVEPLAQDYYFEAPDYFSLHHFNTDDDKVSSVNDVDRWELRLHGSTNHKIVHFNMPNHAFWDYVGNNRSNWIQLFQITSSDTVTATKSSVAQRMKKPPYGFCMARINVSLNWTEGESNSDIGFRRYVFDEQGNRHFTWIKTRSRMNVLSL